MFSPIAHEDLLPATWPFASLLALTLLAMAAWVASHRLPKWLMGSVQSLSLQLLFGAVRTALATLSLFLFINLLGRFLVLETTYSLWLLSLAFGFAIELVIGLYDWEASIVSPTIGRSIIALRVAGVLLLGLIVLQPVFAWNVTQIQERFVAILVDQSTSMSLSDEQLTDSEKLALLRVLDPELPVAPYDLAGLSQDLRKLAEQLSLTADSCRTMAEPNSVFVNASPTGAASETSQRSLSAVALEVSNLTDQATAQLNQVSERLRDFSESDLNLPATARQQAEQLQELIEGRLQVRLSSAKELATVVISDSSPLDATLIDHLNATSAGVRELAGGIPALADQGDQAFFASLPPEVIRRAELIEQRTRAQIARGLLLGEAGTPQAESTKGLLEKVLAGYSVRCFGFDSTVREVGRDQIATLFPAEQTALLAGDDSSESAAADDSSKEAAPSSSAQNNQAPIANTDSSSSPMIGQRTTDLATALAYVKQQIPSENLAGILVISDGRQSQPNNLDQLATQFSALSVPISSLVVGSIQPPVDAKLLEVTKPNTVLVGDSLVIGARVSITGMRGQQVSAKLVSQGETLTERTIEVPEDEFVTSLELSYEPEEEGLVDYEVVLEPLAGQGTERSEFLENNRRSLSVSVTDERTKILVIEGKPRWEYGYLRNLFSGRDERVQLQTVLLEPDRLASTSSLPSIPASVARASTRIEATALPENETEWFKFDVVVLGDVPPERISAEQQELLKRFVAERGGALIVISGMHHMPHAWQESGIEELFPIEVDATREVQFAAPEESFQWQLTSVGQRHAITRQGDSIEASRAVWQRMPDLYWRHSVNGIKPGSVILAYAEPNEPVSEATGDANQSPTEPTTADSANELTSQAEREQDAQARFEEQHALLAIRNYGAGRVLMLATDHTWRFRYRVGDIYHHRFWGQIARWGASDKLQAGSDFVQLGTDRSEYELGAPITLTARLADENFAPLEDDRAEIRVYRGSELILAQRLSPAEGRPGEYGAVLTSLEEAGNYRLELHSSVVDAAFAGSTEAKVSTSIDLLAPETASPEMQETTSDRQTLERLALRTGGALIEDTNADLSRWFAEGTRRYDELRRIRFWDSWPLLVMMVAVFTAEWILRKKGGLV